MAAPSGLIVGWPGTVGSIPAGWSRATGLDEVYPRSDTAYGGTGGSNTHTDHTLVTHQHTYNHNHALSAANQSLSHAVISTTPPVLGYEDSGLHTHAAASASGVANGNSGNASTLTIGSGSTQPGRYQVIFIKSNGTSDIPEDALMWMAGTIAPSNWAKCTGASGTPDIRNLYLRGANAGGNGGTRVVAAGHSHNYSHTHSIPSHTHAGASGFSAASIGSQSVNQLPGGVTTLAQNHTHGASGTSGSASGTTDNPNESASAGDSTVDPPYVKYWVIQHTATEGVIPTGVIGIWDGSAGSIPANWNACDGTSGTASINGLNRFMKCANTDSDVGSTGGSSTHGHTWIHTHDEPHVHTWGNTGAVSSASEGKPAGATNAQPPHTHPVGQTGDPTTGSFNLTMPSATNNSIPAYREVIFIQSLNEVFSSTDTYTVAMTETESIVVVQEDADTYTVAMTETESLAFITITVNEPDPGDTETDATVTIDFTIGGGTQYSYRIEVATDSSGTNVVYDTGTLVSGASQHDIPPGTLQTGQTYYVRVTVTDDGGLVALSDWVEFFTSFATSVNVEDLTATRVGHMCEANVLPHIRLDWTEVVPSIDETFIEYDVLRREVGEENWTRIAIIEDIDTVSYKDATVISGTNYEYSVVWQADTSGGVLTSVIHDPAIRQSVKFMWAFLHEKDNQSYWVPVEALEIAYPVQQDIQYRRAWGRRKPTAFIGEHFTEDVEVQLLEQMRTSTLRERLLEIVRRQYTAGSVLVFRSGIDRTRRFVHVSDVSPSATNELQWSSSLTLSEVHHEEAVP